jgi:hypothetical protein
MSNTISSDLIKEVLNDSKVVTTLGTRVAPWLDALSVQVAVDPVAPNANINVPVVSAGPTVQTNATNFQSGNSTVGLAQVAASQLTASFHITNTEANTGYSLMWLLKKAMQVLGIKVVDTILAEATTDNFGTAPLDVTAANFASTDLKTIWAGGNGKNFNQHNLALDGAYYAKILPTSLESFTLGGPAYGFDRIMVNNRWTGAGSGVIGFHFDSEAIAVGLGFPKINAEIARDMLASENVILEELGLPVQFNQWVDRSTRTMWASLDIMCGADKADTTAAEVITDGGS